MQCRTAKIDPFFPLSLLLIFERNYSTGRAQTTEMKLTNCPYDNGSKESISLSHKKSGVLGKLENERCTNYSFDILFSRKASFEDP